MDHYALLYGGHDPGVVLSLLPGDESVGARILEQALASV